MVEIWTDGSSKYYKGEWFGGSAAVLYYKGVEKVVSEGCVGYTNNMSELKAVIIGLRSLKRSCEVKVFTDSNYTIQCVTNWMPKWIRMGWKTSKGEPVKNKNLIVELHKLCNIHQVEFVKVKAHSGIDKNEQVDKIAKNSSKEVLSEYYRSQE